MTTRNLKTFFVTISGIKVPPNSHCFHSNSYSFSVESSNTASVWA